MNIFRAHNASIKTSDMNCFKAILAFRLLDLTFNFSLGYSQTTSQNIDNIYGLYRSDIRLELTLIGKGNLNYYMIFQVAMATGCVLFQRFFYAKSLVRYPFDHVAMACIGLASKIEESPRRVRDIINVFHHIKQVRNGR